MAFSTSLNNTDSKNRIEAACTSGDEIVVVGPDHSWLPPRIEGSLSHWTRDTLTGYAGSNLDEGLVAPQVKVVRNGVATMGAFIDMPGLQQTSSIYAPNARAANLSSLEGGIFELLAPRLLRFDGRSMKEPIKHFRAAAGVIVGGRLLIGGKEKPQGVWANYTGPVGTFEPVAKSDETWTRELVPIAVKHDNPDMRWQARDAIKDILSKKPELIPVAIDLAKSFVDQHAGWVPKSYCNDAPLCISTLFGLRNLQLGL